MEAWWPHHVGTKSTEEGISLPGVFKMVAYPQGQSSKAETRGNYVEFLAAGAQCAGQERGIGDGTKSSLLKRLVRLFATMKSRTLSSRLYRHGIGSLSRGGVSKIVE